MNLEKSRRQLMAVIRRTFAHGAYDEGDVEKFSMGAAAETAAALEESSREGLQKESKELLEGLTKELEGILPEVDAHLAGVKP